MGSEVGFLVPGSTTSWLGSGTGSLHGSGGLLALPATPLAPASPADARFASAGGRPATIGLDDLAGSPAVAAASRNPGEAAGALGDLARAFGMLPDLLDSFLASLTSIRPAGGSGGQIRRSRPRREEARPRRYRSGTGSARRRGASSHKRSGSKAGRGAGDGSSQGAGHSGKKAKGGVDGWIDQAIAILRERGVPRSKLDRNGIKQIIMKESGGNPRAVNNWDSNAKAGHPSKGLMQTIDSTFRAYKLKGHGDVFNPVDNIIAGVRYALSRYGSIAKVPGIAAMARGGSYRGY